MELGKRRQNVPFSLKTTCFVDLQLQIFSFCNPSTGIKGQGGKKIKETSFTCTITSCASAASLSPATVSFYRRAIQLLFVSFSKVNKETLTPQ